MEQVFRESGCLLVANFMGQGKRREKSLTPVASTVFKMSTRSLYTARQLLTPELLQQALEV